MTTIRFRRPSRCLLAATLLALGLPAAAADLRQRLSVRQEASEVVLGETMQHYYKGDSFAALHNLVLAKNMGRIDESVTSAEMLLGDLYTGFGMSDEAGVTFARIINRDMRSQTRNETLFRQGRLYYRQGSYFEAERILSVPLEEQMTPLETERRVMLSNVLMTRNAFEEAKATLAPVPLDNPLGPYAIYNSGVSLLRSGQTAEGKRLLEQLMQMPADNNEVTSALKDRAALALGYDYLQMQEGEKARNALISVRLKGPFSNEAMLALGWSYYQRKDYKRALAYWLELLTRNTADKPVQEALLLAPRSYEALQAPQQALYGYQLAASTLTSQLETLEKLQADVVKPDWLDQLDPHPEADTFGDPLAIADSVLPRDPVTTAHLYSLLSHHPFNEAYRQYVQLKRLRSLLDRRSVDLRAMRDMAAWHRGRQAVLQTLAARIAATQQRLTDVAARQPAIDKLTRQQAVRGNLGSARSAPTGLKSMERQFKLQQIESALNRQDDSVAARNLRERLRILKGLAQMENASRAAPSQEEVYGDLARSEAQLRLLQIRMEAVQRLLAESRKLASQDHESRLRDLDARLQDARRNIGVSLDEYRIYLGQIARGHIDDSRNRINSDVAEAHLSIARLQDVSLIRDKLLAPTTAPAPAP